MATLYISYYNTVENNCAKKPMASETVTTSGTTAAASSPQDVSCVAMLFSDAAHYITTNESATATAGGYLPASVGHWLALEPGDVISAITV